MTKQSIQLELIAALGKNLAYNDIAQKLCIKKTCKNVGSHFYFIINQYLNYNAQKNVSLHCKNVSLHSPKFIPPPSIFEQTK